VSQAPRSLDSSVLSSENGFLDVEFCNSAVFAIQQSFDSGVLQALQNFDSAVLPTLESFDSVVLQAPRSLKFEL